MDWTDEIGPDRGFLLVNEMSDHLPIYVWGRNARGALAPGGLRLRLRAAPCTPIRWTRRCTACASELGATDADLAGLTVYLQYSAYRTPSGMYRRVEEAWHLRTDDAGALAPVRLAALDGGRSPSLTGAQRLPVPPTLAGDGGRSRPSAGP